MGLPVATTQLRQLDVDQRPLLPQMACSVATRMSAAFR